MDLDAKCAVWAAQGLCTSRIRRPPCEWSRSASYSFYREAAAAISAASATTAFAVAAASEKEYA